jgi:predicted nucleic acid-binding protein
MTLLDTSSLVHFLRRKGDPVVKARLRGILRGGDAAICDMVAVELWMGVGSEEDARAVEALTSVLVLLPTDAGVWNLARRLAARCRREGRPVPASDVVIAACAFANGAGIDAEDAHFEVLRNLRE